MTRNQRSYYAVVRELKNAYGLSHTQARKVRSVLTDKLGVAPRVKDLKGHPIITKRAVAKVSKSAAKVSKSAPKRIDSISQWDDYLDDYDGGFDEIEYDDTGEYKETQ